MSTPLAKVDTTTTHDPASSAGRRWPTRPAIGAAVLIALTTFVGSFTMIAHTPTGVPWLDGAARSAVSMHGDATLNNVMRVLTSFGDELSLLFIFVALAGWAYATRGPWWAQFFLVVMAGALALDNTIKPLVGRPRPIFDQLIAGRGPSFPSGHATGTTALLFALAYYASTGRGRGVRIVLWSAALSGSILMAATRVYLGVHWPTDVMAGILLGMAWAIVCALSHPTGHNPRPVPHSINARRALLPLTITLALVGIAFTSTSHFG